MLFTIVGRFTNGDAAPVSERFRSHGRLLPDGVTCLDSWVDTSHTTWFPLMAAEDVAAVLE